MFLLFWVFIFGDGGCGCFVGLVEFVVGSFDVNVNGFFLFSVVMEVVFK